MEVIILPSKEDCAKLGGQLIFDLVKDNPECVLGLATGSTPVPLYEELIRLHEENNLSFSNVTSFNLDEYIGLSKNHPCSYRYFMQKQFFDSVDINFNSTHVPNGLADDIQAECEAYEQSILDAGGIDLQILGIGSDGHIGFNEPCSSLSSRTRMKTLTGETIKDNARFFESENDVPRHCITMGVGTILDTKSVLLFAFGEGKSDVISKAIEGPISSMVPASALQLHPKVKVILDEPAATKLVNIDYYKEVYANRPSS